MLFEDANDLIDFLEYSKRTIPRTKWAEESVALVEAEQVESLF